MTKKIIILLTVIASLSCASFARNSNKENKNIINGRCALHSDVLIDETLPIKYGLLKISLKYYEYHDKYFPNYEPFIMGGCMASDDMPQEKSVKICPACKQEYHRLKDQFQI